MASCAIEYKENTFFGLNTSISIDENLEITKPDFLFINAHFITPELLQQMLSRFGNQTKVYNIDYLIPNYYVRGVNNNGGMSVICLHDNHLINPNKLICINGYYPAIYSYDIAIDHPQFAGIFHHTKELFTICNTKNTIIDASGGYLEGFCKFYGWDYGLFKPSGTISFTKDTNIQKIYLTNKEIYEQQNM